MNPAALITGSSRGIGRAIAIGLAGLGFDVIVNYANNREAADETARACVRAAQLQGKIIQAPVVQADISSGGDRKRLIESAQIAPGRLDILVNNAGVAPRERADLLDVTEESFDRLMSTNVRGPFFLTQLAARWMLELDDAGRYEGMPRPKIVTISSVSATMVSTHRGDYCMAKAALSMLTPLYAARLAVRGVLVYEIRPGIIETDMTRAVHPQYDAVIAGGAVPLRRWGQPEDVARAVAAIARDDLPFSTGEVIHVDGGLHLQRL
jgi:NAD(P)-dependent dehydrogenase (short-subunit alcohol dehydrogenase family)